MLVNKMTKFEGKMRKVISRNIEPREITSEMYEDLKRFYKEIGETAKKVVKKRRNMGIKI